MAIKAPKRFQPKILLVLGSIRGGTEVKWASVACLGSAHRLRALRAQSATPTMSNPDIKALDIEPSWNREFYMPKRMFQIV